MNIFLYGLIYGILVSLRNLFFSKSTDIDYNIIIMLMVICNIIFMLFYFIFNLNSNINIIINGIKFTPLPLFYFSIAILLNLFAFMYYFKSYLHINRTSDTNLITITIASTMPLCITIFLYYILGIEKYKIQTYFGILAMLIGNVGLIKYWDK